MPNEDEDNFAKIVSLGSCNIIHKNAFPELLLFIWYIEKSPNFDLPFSDEDSRKEY